MATIGGNLYTRHAKNLNYVHKDSKDLMSVIIILGTDVHGGETVFYDGENMNDIGKRAHLLKHSHGRCVIGSFDKILHKGSLWNGHRDVISFILLKSIFLHFVHNGTKVYDKYISTKNWLKIIDDDGSGVLPKILVRKWSNARYQKSYSNHEFVLKMIV